MMYGNEFLDSYTCIRKMVPNFKKKERELNVVEDYTGRLCSEYLKIMGKLVFLFLKSKLQHP